MGFYIDFSSISTDQLKSILTTMQLIPSWKILEEDIDSRFQVIKKQGINNMEEMLVAFKTKDKIRDFSTQTGVPEKYLTILNRMIKGYKQKPVKFRDFVWLETEVVEKLEVPGYKNTLKLYPEVLTARDRESLGKSLDLSQKEILRLTKLTDLTRIRWVNHTFAYVLLMTGYDTAEKVSHADPVELYEAVKKFNEEMQIYKAHIGLNDMKMVIDAARLIDFEIEY